MERQVDKKPTRDILRERNRMALITATLDCVAELGIAGTSVSAIIERAGLSRGMIHLHFDGKDKLLEEAAQQLNAQYYDTLDAALLAAGPSPEEQVEAIVRTDLSVDLLNERYANIWYAFRGEARKRDSIAVFSNTRDARLRNRIFQTFLAIARSAECPEPEQVARDAAHGTLALLEGMWADFLLHPHAFRREEATRIVLRFLAGLFPSHFTLSGAQPAER
ncbi:TetR family transcriptional regulator [Aquicoccus sp. SCR17]|nr:TetR family transcriptional regulator [Carideicomes alvinocaridis]